MAESDSFILVQPAETDVVAPDELSSIEARPQETMA